MSIRTLPDQYMFEIARYVGITGAQMERLIGVLKLCQVKLAAAPPQPEPTIIDVEILWAKYRTGNDANARMDKEGFRAAILEAVERQTEPADHLAAPDSRERATNVAATLCSAVRANEGGTGEPSIFRWCSPCGKLLKDDDQCFKVAATQGDPVAQSHTGTETIGCNSPNAPAAAPLLNEHGKPYVDLPDFDSLAAAPNARTILDNLPHINYAAAIEILEGLAGQSAPAPVPAAPASKLPPIPNESEACEFDNEDKVVALPDYLELRLAALSLEQRVADLMEGQEIVEAHPPCTGANDPVPAAPDSTSSEQPARSDDPRCNYNIDGWCHDTYCMREGTCQLGAKAASTLPLPLTRAEVLYSYAHSPLRDQALRAIALKDQLALTQSILRGSERQRAVEQDRAEKAEGQLAERDREIRSLKSDVRFQFTEKMLEAASNKQRELEAELAELRRKA